MRFVFVLLVLFLACSVSAEEVVKRGYKHKEPHNCHHQSFGHHRHVRREELRDATEVGCRGEITRYCQPPVNGFYEDWWKCLSDNMDRFRTPDCQTHINGMIACRNFAVSSYGPGEQSPDGLVKHLLHSEKESIPSECRNSRFYKDAVVGYHRRQQRPGMGEFFTAAG
ncbi:P21 protein, partial [Trypanosoma cruzi]